MKFTIFSAVLLAALSAHADFADLENAPGSKYDVLLESYRSSTAPASAADFGDQPKSALHCDLASKQDPDTLSPTSIGVETALIQAAVPATPGTPAQVIPGNGPLFPGRTIPGKPGTPAIPEKTATVIIMDQSPDTMKPEDAALFTNQTTATDFVIALAKNSKGIYSDLGAPVSILVRKKDGYLPFIVTKPGISGPLYVGYCYSADQAK
jgi:hypothetical protein